MIFIICFFITIIIHEFGHLLACLLCNVKVKAYSIGFGKILWHKKWKNIDWRFSLLPFGGYCDIDEDKKNSRSLINQKYRYKVFIFLAGCFMNFLLASLCYLVNFKSITIGVFVDFQIIRCIIFKEIFPLYLLFAVDYTNYFFLQLSILNLATGILNLIPIPSLDGGQIWCVLLHKKISKETIDKINKSGFILAIWIQLCLLYYIIFV